MGRQPAVVQSAPEDPKFLLDPDNIPEPTWLHDKFLPGFGALGGMFLMVYRNHTRRRPFYAGAHVIAASTLLGGVIGYLVNLKNQSFWSQRDAIYRHYVSLHPEDFPPKERVLVGDMLKPWYPTR